jgi:hypothetical protein
MTVQFRTLPPFGGDSRAVSEVVNGIMNGKTNNTGEITLNQGATSTTLTNERISANSVILFMPLNDHAADELAHGHMYVSARNKGSATITHGNHMHDMIFAYVIVG